MVVGFVRTPAACVVGTFTNRLVSAITQSLRLFFELRRLIVRYPIGEPISCRLEGRILGEVVELIGIPSVIVEFLLSIVIDNKPPVTTADRVISKV